ncbi:MAG: cytochrome c peroxidase, partial [Prosthecobacter sp.]
MTPHHFRPGSTTCWLPSLLAVLTLMMTAELAAQPGILDLTTLPNYAAQPVPTYISRDNTTAGNTITDAGAALGRVLFYDKRLSRNDTISCSSCHQQAHGFSDLATASSGVNGTTGRHAMRLINSRFATEVRFFWDERATTLEDQTTRPIQDHVEMGFSGTDGDPAFSDLITKLSAIEEYRVLFALMFGEPTITEARVQSALAQFVRSIQSFDSRYDIGRGQVNADNVAFPNFTAQENNGKQLFLNPPNLGGAGCAGCHRPPEFDIDPNSRNNGVIASLGGGTDLTNTRAPSLRDLENPGGTLNGGLMHDGSFTSIDQVINHYAAIPGDNTNLDNRLRRPGGNVQTLNLNP